MNATDTRDYIVNGFANLISMLDANAAADPAVARARAQRAMEREQARVLAEYTELGAEPPSPLALSITARLAMGLPLPEAQIPDAWMEAGE